MKKTLLIMAAMLMCMLPIQAQVSQILGEWYTVDDKTGDQYSIVKIYKATDGKYYGKIAKMLVDQDAVCDKCPDADHNKPLEGLIIIRGFEEKDGQLVNGRVLDPESGKFYYGKLYIKDGHLVLRGSLDKKGILGRSQTWIRKK